MRLRLSSISTAAIAAALFMAAAPPPQAANPTTLPFTIAADTTVVISPLLPDGTPDYVGALNEKYGKGVTPETNALLPLLQIRGTKALLTSSSGNGKNSKIQDRFLELAGTTPTPPDALLFQIYPDYLQSQKKSVTPTSLTQLNGAALKIWTADQAPDLAAYLKSQDKFFDLAVEASKRPRYFVPFVAADNHLSTMETFSNTGLAAFGRAWCARAMLRGSSGNFDGALSDSAAIKRLGRLFSSSGTIIANLLGGVYDNMANESLGVLASSGKLTEAQCEAAAKMIEMPSLPSLSDACTLERWNFLDFIVHKATGQAGPELKGADPQIIATINSIDSSAVDWNFVLRFVNTQCDREAAMFNIRSLDEMNQQARDLDSLILEWKIELLNHNDRLEKETSESHAAYSERVAHGLLVPRHATALLQRGQLLADSQLRSEMLQTLLAAAKSRAHNGQWPKALNELVPSSLKQIPRDPYSPTESEPITYRLSESGPTLISVGPDRTPDSDDDILIGVR